MGNFYKNVQVELNSTKIPDNRYMSSLSAQPISGHFTK